MRIHQRKSPRISKIVFALVLAFSVAWIAFVDEDSSSQVAAQTLTQIEVTIFSYDGQDFIRTQTTLVTDEGKSAVNTKLDRSTPAYKALIQKRSYTGDATLFGRKYDTTYAPLIGEDGQLTGALFVAVTK
ncbi:MAG: Cache 3/Cache 2 fusion domain-containing protein [Gammaproteobacteria bacterium]|nr:Cache 3/Cache 2 fusion domain-containing protein [Gammaproteobacteria bacterium]